MSENIAGKASHVAIGCKIPNGFLMQLKDTQDRLVEHRVNGASNARVVGGYGITEGIPAEFADAWFKKYEDHPAVLKKQIFYHAKADTARAIAKEHRELATGLDPIDPVKTGMLKGADGAIDKAALADYEKLKKENPDRNLQRVE